MLLVARICALVALVSSNFAFAGNVWDGGGSNNNWTTGNNWNSDNQPPANNGSITVVMGGTTRLAPNVDTPYNINGLVFNFDAGEFVLGGQTLTIGAGGITQGDTGSQRINNFIQIGASQTWDAFSGPLAINGTINLGGGTPHTLNISGNFDTTIFGKIQGFGTLVKFGAGVATISGAFNNTYVGATIVNSGTLVLANNNSVTAIPTNLTIGDGTGVDVVRALATFQIAPTANVTINSSGVLDITGGDELLGSLTMTGGTVRMSAGLGDSGHFRVAGALTFNPSATTATFERSTFELEGARTLDVPNGSATVDLLITSLLTNGGITKNGAGTMRLTRESLLYLPTVVNAGELQLGCTTGPAIQRTMSGDASLTIGDDIGGQGADRVVFTANQQVGRLLAPNNTPAVEIDVRNSGLLDTNGFTEDILNLNLIGGQVSTGNGSIGFHSFLTVGASSFTSSISGRLQVNGIAADGAPHNVISVADGPAAIDLDISAAISDYAANTSFYKSGPGHVRLSGSSVSSHVATLLFSNGTITLAKTVPNAALSSVMVGYSDSLLSSGPSTLRLEANEQIAGSVALTSTGLFDMNGFSETLVALGLSPNAGAGRLVTGGGVLTVGALNMNSNTSIDSGAGTIALTGAMNFNTLFSGGELLASVFGQIDLTGGARTFAINDGSLQTDFQLNAALHNGGWTKTGGGQLELTGAAVTNTGTVTVAAGTVLLNKSDIDSSIRGPLLIGDGSGPDVVRLLASEQILASPSAPVSLIAGGMLDLNNFDETIGPLAMSGGSIAMGTAKLQVTGDVTVTGASTSTIDGKLDLGAGTRTTNVADGAGSVDFDVIAVLSNGGITKTGPGTLRLAGGNTFAGGASMNGGRMLVASDGALGAGAVILISGTLESEGSPRTISNSVSVTGSVAIVVDGASQFALSGSFTNAGSGVTKLGTGSLVLAGAQIYAPGSTLDVNAGVVRFDTDADTTGEANLVLRVNTATAELRLVGPQHLASLSVINGRALMSSANSVLVTRSLSVDNSDAKVDLNQGNAVINYTASSPMATIKSALISGRNGGTWDGFGITSSAAAAQPSHNTTLGLMASSDYFSLYGAGAPFEGESIDATAVLIKYTWYGDSDFNGVVNFDDYSRTDSGFNTGGSDWLHGDFDFNGVVNFDDYSLIDLAFNTQSGTLRRALAFLDGNDRSDRGMDEPALRIVEQHFVQFGQPYATSLLAAVPEPVSATALFVAISGLACRRANCRRR